MPPVPVPIVPPVPKIPKCPECDTQLVLVNGELPEECAKCGFILAGWDIFERWMAAYRKKNAPPEPEPEAKPVSRNPLSGLMKRKKK